MRCSELYFHTPKYGDIAYCVPFKSQVHEFPEISSFLGSIPFKSTMFVD